MSIPIADRAAATWAWLNPPGTGPTGQAWLDALIRAISISRTKPLPQRLLLAGLFVGLALVVRLVVLPDFADRPTYVPFHAAVILSAVFAGVGGCLSAAALSVIVTHTLFFGLDDASDYSIFVTFLATAALLTVLVEALFVTNNRWLAAQQDSTRDRALRLFIDQAPVAIAMFDRNMLYMAASQHWRNDFRIETPDLTGTSHYDVFPHLPERLRSIHRRALAGERLSSPQDQFTLNDGTVRWERWEVLPWLMDDGSIGGITIFTEDITARVVAEKELRENKTYLNRAQTVARVGNWRMLFSTDLLQGSAQTFALLEQPETARLNFQMLLDLVHPDDRNRIGAIRKSALKGECYDVEYRFVIAGRTGWMRERAEPEFDAAGKLIGAFGVIQDITDRKSIEHDLSSSEERLRLALEAAGMGVWDLNLTTGADIWNDQCYRILGYEPGDVKSSAERWMSHVHPEERTNIAVAFSASLKNGEDISNEHRIIDQKGLQKWVSVRGRTARDARGRPIRSFGVITDISDRKQAEERDRLLTLEVNHRAKNLLAVVQAVALQTARQHEGSTFVEHFNRRIKSLAASHDLLVNSKWQGVSVADLVCAQLAHFDGLVGTRIHFDGDPASLSPAAAQSLGLALHELVTNASKYGALATTGGTVAINWQVADRAGEQVFEMNWQEAGGPPVTPPSRQGFGHSVLVSMAEYALAANVSLSFPPEGLRWQLQAPAKHVLRSAPLFS